MILNLTAIARRITPDKIVNDPTIRCPHCDGAIKLTESLAAPLVESARKKFEQDRAVQQAEIAKREAAIRQQQESIAAAKLDLDAQVKQRVLAERQKIAQEESVKARELFNTELHKRDGQLRDLEQVLKNRDEKLALAQKAQVELIRKQRELDEAKREMELTVERTVQEKLNDARAKAKQETEEQLKFAEEQLKLKVLEREKTISDMSRQIEDLKRKSEQGSEQLFGEVLELRLESLLREKFPIDRIEPVPKGECGGDVVHRIVSTTGQPVGAILWESKRTRNWSDGWLSKLRDDQRAAKADAAILVSSALPKGVEHFSHCDDVWVVDPRCAIPVAIMVRHWLLELAAARAVGQGQNTKVEMVYHYLTGPRFRQRVEAIVEKFSDMRENLDKERKFLAKQWAMREAQINSVIESTAGMVGDLQGIAGKAVAEFEELDLKLIEGSE